MAHQESYDSESEVDHEPLDPEVMEAQAAWVEAELSEPAPVAPELSSPFVGQWHELISRTNWEKGRIISEWRQALIEAGSPATAYSDEAWAQQVGGVTAPHVGRLRRVYDHFQDSWATYANLSWTHFLVAMDWDDAPLWLQGASDGGWSVSGMRKQRWETLGGAPEDRPDDAALVVTDTDEDFIEPVAAGPQSTQPAQGGGSTRQYDQEPDGISAGPVAEAPDFGEEESLERLPAPGAGGFADEADAPTEALVQPFAGLPQLPDDLADAVELLKLSIVRHKAAGWNAVSLETVRSYLTAFLVLIEARSR